MVKKELILYHEGMVKQIEFLVNILIKEGTHIRQEQGDDQIYSADDGAIKTLQNRLMEQCLFVIQQNILIPELKKVCNQLQKIYEALTKTRRQGEFYVGPPQKYLDDLIDHLKSRLDKAEEKDK